VDTIDTITQEIAYLVNESELPFTYPGKNTAVAVKAETPTTTTVSAHQSNNNSGELDIKISSELDTESTLDNDSLVRIFIPAEAFGNRRQVVSSIFYRKDTLFQTEKELTREESTRITSNVLKVRVGNQTVDGLSEKLVLRFKKTSLDTKGTHKCVFWNFSLRRCYRNIFITSHSFY